MNPPLNTAFGAGHGIAIVHPREPMSGAPAVAVQEDRLNENGALERERAKRIWRVRGIISDTIPLGGDIRSGPAHRLDCANFCAHPADRWAHVRTASHMLGSRLSCFVSAGTLKTGRLFLVVLLPWAQEARGSNPRAPTIYFFVFNLLCLTWSASEPELGSIWVQIQAARHFPQRDAALPGSRANKSRA